MRTPNSLYGRIHVRSGFLQVTLTTAADVRAIFDSPAGIYLRWIHVAANLYEVGAIVRFLAVREHPWLAELEIEYAIVPNPRRTPHD